MIGLFDEEYKSWSAGSCTACPPPEGGAAQCTKPTNPKTFSKHLGAVLALQTPPSGDLGAFLIGLFDHQYKS